jgi:carboxyl-terminal processing protease
MLSKRRQWPSVYPQFPRKMSPISRFPAVLAALLVAAGCAAIDPHNMLGRRDTSRPTSLPASPVPATAGPGLGAADRQRAFEFVWGTINERYYDPKLNGVDWNAARARYEPLALSAPNDDAFWETLDRMTGELKDAHTRVESPKRAEQIGNNETVSLGFSFVPLDGKLVIAGVNGDSDAYYAGVRSGMRIVTIDGVEALAAFEKLKAGTRFDSTERSRHLRAVRKLTAGEPDSTVAFTFERADGSRIDATLKRRKLTTAAFATSRILPSGFGYLRLSQWTLGASNRMITGLSEVKNAPGLIVDLRGNPGGSLLAVKNVMAQFFDKRTEIGRTLTRTGRPVSMFFGALEVIELNLAVPGSPEAYKGPVIVLVNESSGSGSEFFAGSMQALGRATVLGQPTCGCLLGFLGYASVPGGGELAYSEIGFVMSNGKRIEGEGVIPDHTIPLALADLQLNRDRVLEEAQAILAATAKKPKT